MATKTPKPECPYIPEHKVENETVKDLKSGKEIEHWYCVEHREIDGSHTGDHWSRIENLKRTHSIQWKLEYKEKVQPSKEGMNITDEELKSYFNDFQNKYLKVDVLQEVLGPTETNPKPLIKLNWPQDEDKPTAIVPSSYMRRLSTYTRKRWRQKRHKGEDGEPLVRFWTDGSYDPEEEKYKREIRKREKREKLAAANRISNDKKLHQENLKLYEEIKKKEMEAKKK